MSDRELERNSQAARFITKVTDDGWNLPFEAIEEIRLRIIKAYDDAYLAVYRAKRSHKGAWLTAEVAKKYETKSWVWRAVYDNQYIGELRRLGQELMDRYGVTELEAVNILNGRNVMDYVAKYDRIRKLIPMNVNEERIAREVREMYA